MAALVAKAARALKASPEPVDEGLSGEVIVAWAEECESSVCMAVSS